MIQLFIGFAFALIPQINLFQIVVFTQTLNAMALPPIFYYLIKITNSKEHMGEHVNSPFQRWAVSIGTVLIIIAAIVTVILTIMGI